MQITNNSVYIWMVINHRDGSVIERITSVKGNFSTIFARAGTYEVMVQIWNIHSQKTLLLNATTTIIIKS